MKKILIYSGILIVGLFLGYLIFGESAENDSSDTQREQEATTMWTCSMHPQIMQKEKGDCPICGMDLIPAETTYDGLSANQFSLTENAMKLANIQTTVVGNGSGSNAELTLSGKIEVNEDNKAVMPAHFDGRVEKLYVNTVGDRVNMGQMIASVYSPELVAAQQELLTAVKLKNSQPGLYQAVRNKFKNWKIKSNLLDEIESSGMVRTSWPIYSHVTGTVTEIMVEEGAHIMNGMPILKVSNLNSVWAIFDAYESQISNLREGQTLDIAVNALKNENLSGKIAFIDPILNSNSRTVEVRVVLNNSDGKLKPGMFVEAEVQAGNDSNSEVLEVPRSAVMWTGERSLVYVKTNSSEPVFEMREVTLGNASAENFQVLSGLQHGEEIVTNGTFTVDAAAQLQGKNSMMNENLAKDNFAKLNISESFQKSFRPVLEEYFNLKDALVASDLNKSSEVAQDLLKNVQNLERNNSEEKLAAHLHKMNEMVKAISDQKDLNQQREHFRILSQQMILIVQNLPDLDRIIYVQHCPMANNNHGADWLSLSSEVKNPYYGEDMLGCGEVVSRIN